MVLNDDGQARVHGSTRLATWGGWGDVKRHGATVVRTGYTRPVQGPQDTQQHLHGLLSHGFEALRRAEASVGIALLEELLRVLMVQRQALRLPRSR